MNHIDIRFQPIIDAYAEIETFSQGKHKAKSLGTTARNMGKNDLWIAATTFTTKAALITTDKDFHHLDQSFIDLKWIKLNS